MGTPELSRAFEREASLLANLHHPALPVVIDHFLEASGQFLVMQFIKGEDLATQLEQREEAFPINEVIKWADQLLDALDYLHLHEPPIVHRDIKPLNIKLGRKGEAILLDFGLAKGALGQMPTMTGGASVFGFSLRYAPLEQIHGAGTDPRSDIYSLGATLYHLITGNVPIDAPTRYNAIEEGRSDPLQPAHHINSEVTESLADVIGKAMAISRRDRWGSATEMREALEAASASRSTPAARAGASPIVAVESNEEATQERLVYFNNCNNRNHVRIYGPDAFYDLGTTGFQSALARNLRLGQKCIVATTGNSKQIVFSWFSFLREEIKPDDSAIPCRVFFGKFIKSEEYSKTEAAHKEPYSMFFDINGNFKRHSVIESLTGRSAIGDIDSRSRSNTTEEEFFETLQNRSPVEANVAKKILDWSRQNFSRVDWKHSSFVPVLDYGAEFSHNPITVFAVGKVPRVGIKFGRMKNRNGLPKEKRIELLGQLNEIPGVRLPADSVDKYPNILLTTLASGDALEQFLRTIAWTNEEVKTIQELGAN
jgi:serine/threonine protein kinase